MDINNDSGRCPAKLHTGSWLTRCMKSAAHDGAHENRYGTEWTSKHTGLVYISGSVDRQACDWVAHDEAMEEHGFCPVCR